MHGVGSPLFTVHIEGTAYMSRVLLDIYTQVKLLPSRMASDTEAPVLQRQKEKSAEQGMVASCAAHGGLENPRLHAPATVEKAKVRTGLRADRVRPVIFRMRMLTAELLGCSDQRSRDAVMHVEQDKARI